MMKLCWHGESRMAVLHPQLQWHANEHGIVGWFLRVVFLYQYDHHHQPEDIDPIPIRCARKPPVSSLHLYNRSASDNRSAALVREFATPASHSSSRHGVNGFLAVEWRESRRVAPSLSRPIFHPFLSPSFRICRPLSPWFHGPICRDLRRIFQFSP